MTSFLAQSEWSPEGVIAVLAALGVFLASAATSITGVVMAVRAMRTAAEAIGKADGAQQSAGRLSSRMNTQDMKVSTLELATVPHQLPTVVMTPPKPQTRRIRLDGKIYEAQLTEICDDPSK